MDGLKREIKEETGITNFEIKGVVGISTKGSGYGVCFHAALVEPESCDIILSEEHDAYAWGFIKRDA